MPALQRILPAILLVLIGRAEAQEPVWPIHASDYKAGEFQPSQSLANYYGLPTPDGGAATPALLESLSFREQSDLLAFAHFPEKTRRDHLKTTLERRASDLEKVAREEAAGKSLRAYVGLTLADGTVVSAAMLDELSPRAKAFVVVFAGFDVPSRERIIRNAFNSLESEKTRFKDKEVEAENQNREKAVQIAADKQQAEERQREREQADAQRARRQAEQEAQRKQRAEEEATRELEALLKKAEEDERRNQAEALAALDREEDRLQRQQEEERRQRELDEQRDSAAAAPEEGTQVAHNNTPSQPSAQPHPAFRTKIDRHQPPMNMEQFRREHMQPANDGGQIRFSGRAIKGVITLGVLLLGGVFAGLRMLFRGSAAE